MKSLLATTALVLITATTAIAQDINAPASLDLDAPVQFNQGLLLQVDHNAQYTAINAADIAGIKATADFRFEYHNQRHTANGNTSTQLIERTGNNAVAIAQVATDLETEAGYVRELEAVVGNVSSEETTSWLGTTTAAVEGTGILGDIETLQANDQIRKEDITLIQHDLGAIETTQEETLDILYSVGYSQCYKPWMMLKHLKLKLIRIPTTLKIML